MQTAVRSRRRVLVSVLGTAAIGALAGCTDDGGAAETTDDGASDDESESADDSTADDSAADDSPAEDLDLREANVVDVTIDGENGEYAFDVALHHDDDGEEGYANWWQVERLDGTQLGRRDLTHAHSQQPFTRSETIDVPDEVECVIVRGHDQTHGYGGRAMLVDTESGETRAVDQGEEQRSFDEDECP